MKSISVKSRFRASLAYPTWLPAFLFFLLILPLAAPKAHGLKNAILVATFILLLLQPLFSWLYLRLSPCDNFDQEHAACALTLNTFFFSVSAGLSILLIATLPLLALWYVLGIWIFLGLALWLSLWTTLSTVAACLAVLGLKTPESLLSKVNGLSFMRRIRSALPQIADTGETKQDET